MKRILILLLTCNSTMSMHYLTNFFSGKDPEVEVMVEGMTQSIHELTKENDALRLHLDSANATIKLLQRDLLEAKFQYTRINNQLRKEMNEKRLGPLHRSASS